MSVTTAVAPTQPLAPAARKPRVVIIGGGFGGLYCAQGLANAPVDITMVDRRNFHLFQPLLYQVATGGLSPANIAAPLRAILRHQRNIHVQLAEVLDIDADNRKVILVDGELEYDTLVVAAGSSHSYFGRDDWAKLAPGLKTIEDSTEIRRRILLAFEAAERQTDPERIKEWLTFIVVGGGPTGVELAGSVAEIARHTLKYDFRKIDPTIAHVVLLEGLDRILRAYPPDLSASATRSLEKIGVVVRPGSIVTEIRDQMVTVKTGDHYETIHARTVLWAAGVQASPLGKLLAKHAGGETDRAGRVIVQPDCSLKGRPEIFVIGDLANFNHKGQPLPGVAPVAMQQGRYVAKLIARRSRGELKAGDAVEPFKYWDRGSMATIGRAAAVADLGFIRYSGIFAWMTWLFIHLLYLAQFQNRLLVLFQWGWAYLTWNRMARLITGENPFPLVHPCPPDEGDESEIPEEGTLPTSAIN